MACKMCSHLFVYNETSKSLSASHEFFINIVGVVLLLFNFITCIRLG